MLPLLRDKSVIALCPDRVIAVRWHKRHIIAHSILPVSGSVLSSVAQLLTDEAFRKTDATLLLSSHFMHFAVMPWNEAFLSAEEELVLAQHHFMELYGESKSWEIRVSGAGIGAPALACAVAEDFIGNIPPLFASSGVRLKSIQPYLMAGFNACRKVLPEGCAWFVLAEKGMYCIALLQDGQWQRIRQLKTLEFDEVLLALERESLLSEQDAGRDVYLYAPRQRTDKIESGSWTIVSVAMSPLPGIADVENYAMTAAVA